MARENWQGMLASVSVQLKENAEELSRMDAVTGDGDHGVTMRKIARVIDDSLEQWPSHVPLKGFFECLSSNIMAVNGGSAGPLWGTLFAGFARGMHGEEDIDEQGIVKMFTAGIDEMREITTAKAGDKTLMDALIPAVKAVQNARDVPLPDMLRLAAIAARRGADSTADYVAKFGRSKNLKEKSLGYRDPGAVSLSMLFDGLAKGVTH